jgi:hypothetical protein
MPQKNIYIRKEDVHIFEMAVNLFGNQGIGAVMAEHLRTIVPQVKDEVFTLLLLDNENLNWVSELVQRRLKDFPEKVILEAKELIEALNLFHPKHGRDDSDTVWWIDLFLGLGSFVEEARKLAEDCLPEYRALQDESNPDPEVLKKAIAKLVKVRPEVAEEVRWLAKANPKLSEDQSDSPGKEPKS